MAILRAELEGVRGIYFDLDDTLCGYWQASKRALAETFATHGPEGYTAEELTKAWASSFRLFSKEIKGSDWYTTYLQRGEPTRAEQMRRMLHALGIEDEARVAVLSESYGRLRDQYLTLFPEALEVLDKLRNEYPLGLITNGPADIQRQEIATLGLGHYFDVILIEGELGEGKPHERVFREAQALMHLEAGELVMIGNSYRHDIQPAIEAGWKTVWIRRPTDIPPSAGDRIGPEELPPGAKPPTMTISDLRELLAK